MRKVQILCCLLAIAVSVTRSQWSPATFPNPQIEPSRCGRGHTSRSWVCDPDGLLSRQSGDVTEGILKSIASGEHPYARAGSCGDRRASQGYQVGSCMCCSTQDYALQIHCKGNTNASEAVTLSVLDTRALRQVQLPSSQSQLPAEC